MASAMASIGNVRENLMAALEDDSKPWSPLLKWAEAKTGLKRFYLFVGAVVFVALYMVFGYAAQLFCNIIGFAYPAYCSIKAIESTNKDDDTKWLTYWVVFAFLTIVEYPATWLTHYFPFYWLIKCLFYVWCFLPIESNGSMTIYRRIIRPKFLKHEDSLKNLTASATKIAADAMADVLSRKSE